MKNIINWTANLTVTTCSQTSGATGFISKLHDWLFKHNNLKLITCAGVGGFVIGYSAHNLKQKYFPHGITEGLEQLKFKLYVKWKGTQIMDAKLNEIQQALRKVIIPEIITKYPKNVSLPIKSNNKNELIQLLTEWSEYEKTLWDGSKYYKSSSVYHGQKELISIQNKAYCLFSVSNAFHIKNHPFVRKMESEIISMTLSLFSGHYSQQCGILTSGGTESIILALRAYANYARKHKNIEHPELIVPTTAHAAFDKGCDLMKIKIIKVDFDKNTYCVSAKEMEKYITSQTIAIVGSAPQFAQGIVDPIKDLSVLAIKYNIGLHVDCCLGSFMLPMLKTIGYEIPEFDFVLNGVTSISCDTHKFGFSNKGTSVLMFKNKEYRKHAYFCYSDLSMGMYATSTILGSRAGGLIAATWITMMYLGYSGYVEEMQKIMQSVEIIKQGLNKIKCIEIMGDPIMSAIALKPKQNNENISEKEIDIFKISDAMSNKGWKFDHCQNPKCIHFCFTGVNCLKPNKFLNDMNEAIRDVLKSPSKYEASFSAVYQKVMSIPSKKFKNDVLSVYWDIAYGIF